MRIGELARRSGVSPRALRYYEEQGLLRPERRPSGYREYDEDDVRTVRDVRTLLAAGLGTATIAAVLPCTAGDEVSLLLPACAPLAEEVPAERDRIEETMRQLGAALGLLREMIDRSGLESRAADGGDGTGCGHETLASPQPLGSR
ncbi:MerR family transcriptional regulator [Streptomyces mobaraensis NBRC 13819 = DSM 40847]|uniref:MerR family transcriptional regulator n=1 Tax=Streptomyces mobaraensis (strain ATCC 29032 / DSM 40847 / JCM 4168 / NBRC 13819 / NCIMB 11159 / IPCR 16-22) TaxID=1223523 RepID=M3ABW3_STRM1|nr:MerR family transcriptional regulator [Streptomyces mobaraensis]EMF02684.1 MerR family transcriptional regulator [Streptomyces mobaraensis NBRC 13819 = DSM 40847]QTT75703.1 MerR family transcriptional regulator [Streptomyces mobaraensis NBRC 13819 = DSM 40847]